jgi:uncharacterized small protein (DUF1192 family)
MTAPVNRVADLLGHLPAEADDIIDNAIDELVTGRLFASEIRTLMNVELAEIGVRPVLRSTFNRWLLQGELHGFQKRQPGAPRVQVPSAIKRFWDKYQPPKGWATVADCGLETFIEIQETFAASRFALAAKLLRDECLKERVAALKAEVERAIAEGRPVQQFKWRVEALFRKAGGRVDGAPEQPTKARNESQDRGADTAEVELIIATIWFGIFKGLPRDQLELALTQIGVSKTEFDRLYKICCAKG